MTTSGRIGLPITPLRPGYWLAEPIGRAQMDRTSRTPASMVCVQPPLPVERARHGPNGQRDFFSVATTVTDQALARPPMRDNGVSYRALDSLLRGDPRYHSQARAHVKSVVPHLGGALSAMTPVNVTGPFRSFLLLHGDSQTVWASVVSCPCNHRSHTARHQLVGASRSIYFIRLGCVRPRAPGRF